MNPTSLEPLTQADLAFTIRRLRCTEVEYPIIPRRVVFSCAGRHDRSRYLLVAMESEQGVTGYGEAACVPLWSGETSRSAAALLRHTLAPLLIGRSFPHPAALCDEMDRTLIDNPFLKCGIDCAAWDMIAKTRGVPVSRLIGDREPILDIPIRASIGAYPPEATVALAKEFWSLGVRTLKFKTGLDVQEDVRRLSAVRDALGDTPIITVDYNGGLPSAAAAIEAIEALAEYGVTLVEQPTPRHRLSMMAEVRRHVGVQIMADEGVFHPDQLLEALDLQAADVLSIYPGKNGGFTRSWQMAKLAERAAIPCVIGSNLESELGQAAMGCLAASLTAFPVTRYACDLLSAFYYADNLVTPVRPLLGGCYRVPTGEGFGISVNDEVTLFVD